MSGPTAACGGRSVRRVSLAFACVMADVGSGRGSCARPDAFGTFGAANADKVASMSRLQWLVLGGVLAALIVVAAVVLITGREPNPNSPTPTAAVAPQPDPAVEAAPPAPVAPSFDVVRISRGGTGVIAGRAAPDAQVEVFAGERLVGRVKADARGEWVLILEDPLPPGSAEFTLRATGPDGTQLAAEDVVVINVPEGQDKGFVPSGRDGVVAVLSPKEGDGASRVLQRPGLGGSALNALAVDTVDYGPERPPVFGGRAEPRASVRVYLDNRFVGQAQADDDGRWELADDRPLDPGEHRVRLDQVLGEGEVELRVEQPFTAGERVDPALAQAGVKVRAGNTLWEISRQLFGTGRQYTLIFRENSEQITDPDLIYPDQVFRLPQGSGKEG